MYRFYILKYICLIIILLSGYNICIGDDISNTWNIHKYSMNNYNVVIKQIYKNPIMKGSDLKSKINYVKRYFLGKPYYLPESPLGEGLISSYDQEPIYRTDTFDCVTLVDTILALIKGHDFNEFKKNIIRIRYRNNTIAYQNRDHWFIQVDWNKTNQQNKFIYDVTKNITNIEGKAIARVAITNINKPNWYRHLLLTGYNNDNILGSIRILKPIKYNEARIKLSSLRLLGLTQKNIKSKLAYIPLTSLLDSNGKANNYIFNQVPSIAVIEIVRPNWNVPFKNPYGTNLNVTHLGLAVRNSKGKLMFIEASSIYRKVVEIPLDSYLRTYLKSSNNIGINIEKII
ncbi:N-acetylmuramoyl-L-alanine amidase-like domain-containing protein [Francisella sp. 19X1-34]|uniref:N-acetylmuramoyl-L-alanine amidase-like domain-containing protein n=1 Tax=Francisella sp. 19X1-34 TaxID=3087177 RepID=UPI002E34A23C|nr:N-acetylmuramoyl-L-alanine amidase-like domain-containing protein [Francisella sp. 19X1-34]